MRIRLVFESVEVTGELNDTPTAQKVAAALPIESLAGTWGEEVYFNIPVSDEEAPDATTVVDPGTICFWVMGGAMAIPFGRTPVSRGDECRLYSNVNILGRLEGDPKALGAVAGGESVRVEKVD